MEAERLEVVGEPRAREVLGDDLRARRERRLDPRLRRQPARDGIAREQPGGEHDRRVGGVRAARDRGDHDVPVVEHVRVPSASSTTTSLFVCWATAAACSSESSMNRRAAVGLVRRRRIGGRERQRRELDGRLLVVAVLVGRQVVLHGDPELRLRMRQRDAVLRALGPRQRRHDLAEVELDRVGVGGLDGVLVVPQPLRRARTPRRGRRAPDRGRRTRGSAASRRRSGRSRRSSRTPGSCCRSSPGRRAAGARARGRRTRRTCRRRRARAASR